jgi:hypothetical protein
MSSEFCQNLSQSFVGVLLVKDFGAFRNFEVTNECLAKPHIRELSMGELDRKLTDLILS